MEQSTVDPGKKISNMERALRLGQMVLLMMDFMKKAKNMAQGNSLGLMVVLLISINIILPSEKLQTKTQRLLYTRT